MYGTYVYSRGVEDRSAICMTSAPASLSCLKAPAFDCGSGGALIELGLKKYSELMPGAGVAREGFWGEPAGSPLAASAHVPVAGARLSQATIALPRGAHRPTTLAAGGTTEP